MGTSHGRVHFNTQRESVLEWQVQFFSVGRDKKCSHRHNIMSSHALEIPCVGREVDFFFFRDKLYNRFSYLCIFSPSVTPLPVLGHQPRRGPDPEYCVKLWDF